MELSEMQRQRYARHLILNQFGEEGQKKLLQGRVLIIGAGGLGSPAALYLAAAGVGTLGLADSDRVELSNLQRQILHGTNDLGREKIQSARESLEHLNPDVKLLATCCRADEQTIDSLLDGYDFVIDATDSFESKFLINDACVRHRMPFSHAGVTRFGGQLMTYVPGKGPCCRCIFQHPPEEPVMPEEKAILSTVPGVIGCLQATEAIKYLTGTGELLTGRLLIFDALSMTFRRIALPDTAEDCPVCHPSLSAKK